MKKGTKIFLSIFLVLTIIFAGISWWWFGFFYSTSSYHYKQVSQYEYNPLPTIESLPEHKSVKYKYFKDYMGVFESEAYTMIVKYNKETYEKQKATLYEPFEKICDWTNTDDENDYPLEKKVTTPFDFKGFSFVMYSDEYPKIIYFVGTNDKTNQIAYIYFSDHDLDEISRPYSVFIDENCGW